MWRSSTRCEGGQCVEVAVDDTTVLIRSSARREDTPVAMSLDRWDGFIAEIKDGAFDQM